MKNLLSLLIACSVVSANAATLQYSVFLDGPSEPSASLGTGNGSLTYDNVSHTLELQVTFGGLTGTTTSSHIHAPTATPFSGTAGVATTTPTFAGFPSGVTSGSYSNTLDLTQAGSYNPSFVTANGGTTAGAEAALTSALANGTAYWNIHSSVFPGGEIRGFIVPVPEPSSLALLGLGTVALGAQVWRKRRANKS